MTDRNGGAGLILYSSERKVKPDANVVNLLLEELTVGGRAVVELSEQPPHPGRMVFTLPGRHGQGSIPGFQVRD